MERSTNGDSQGQSSPEFEPTDERPFEPALQPVAVSVDAQEIAALHVVGTTPDMFMQFLLDRFKAAGAPVEGVIRLRLAHGVVLRFKRQPPGKFRYIWLPEELWHRIQKAGGLMPY